MKSINQINAYCVRSAENQYYLSVDNDRTNYRNAYYTERQYPIIKNCMYAACLRNIERYTGLNTLCYHSTTKRATIAISFAGRSLEFDVIAKLDVFNGVRIQVYNTNFTPMTGIDLPVRSSLSWQSFDLESYFMQKVLPKYLYAPGLFRNIQILNRCNKQRAKDLYRSIKKAPTYYIDSERAIRRRIRKKLNLNAPIGCSDRQLLHILKTAQRQKIRRPVFLMPSVYDILDGYDGDIDGIDNLFNNYIKSEYPHNAIFI